MSERQEERTNAPDMELALCKENIIGLLKVNRAQRTMAQQKRSCLHTLRRSAVSQ